MGSISDKNRRPAFASLFGGGRITILLILSLLIVGTAVYYFFDPAQTVWMPKCLIHSLTGWDCPGCGAQRMLAALVHGDLAGAWRANPFLLCSIPLIGLIMWADLRPGPVRRFVYSPVTILGYATLTILWGILRNFL